MGPTHNLGVFFFITRPAGRWGREARKPRSDDGDDASPLLLTCLALQTMNAQLIGWESATPLRPTFRTWAFWQRRCSQRAAGGRKECEKAERPTPSKHHFFFQSVIFGSHDWCCSSALKPLPFAGVISLSGACHVLVEIILFIASRFGFRPCLSDV